MGIEEKKTKKRTGSAGHSFVLDGTKQQTWVQWEWKRGEGEIIKDHFLMFIEKRTFFIDNPTQKMTSIYYYFLI